MSPIIAVDGPAASGKGTLARKLAKVLGFAYLDTGQIYRAVAFLVLEQSHNPDEIDFDIHVAQHLNHETILGLIDDPRLRDENVGQAASKVAVIPEVRQALLEFQRYFANFPPEPAKGAVLDGRDIGTIVCPQADVKFFLTANIDVRAKRRLEELKSKGIHAKVEDVLKEMIERDKRDTQRASAPLKRAADAHLIDTSFHNAASVLDECLTYVSMHLGKIAK